MNRTANEQHPSVVLTSVVLTASITTAGTKKTTVRKLQFREHKGKTLS
jgi:hypothetical protein